MTNLLNNNYLVCAVVMGVIACGGRKTAEPPTPAATAPLPTAGLAGQRVSLLPLTLVAAEDSLRWDALIGDRRATLDRGDSILGALLGARAPEVTWVGPAELRRAARRAAGIAADPDQMGTALLRSSAVVDIPDPLRYQLRTLVGLAGGRYALVPAGLVYRRPPPPGSGTPTAELSVVLIDTRVGRVGWRTIARGEGDDPWTALARAVKSLTPGLP